MGLHHVMTKSKTRSEASSTADLSTDAQANALGKNTKAKSLQDLPPSEPKYLMRVNAPGVSGDMSDGDLVLLTRDEMPKYGDAVCVHTENGNAVLVTLDVDLCEADWKRMPFEWSAADECVSVVTGAVLGGTIGLQLQWTSCLPSTGAKAGTNRNSPRPKICSVFPIRPAS